MTATLASGLVDSVGEWMGRHGWIAWTALGVSLLLVVGTLIALPKAVVAIPADYYTHDRRPRSRLAEHHPAVRIVLRVLKNIAGVVLIVLGVLMLVLPGQGLLTLVVGFLLIDIPGKYRIEKRVMRIERVRRALNWLRRRHDAEPLQKP